MPRLTIAEMRAYIDRVRLLTHTLKTDSNSGEPTTEHPALVECERIKMAMRVECTENAREIENRLAAERLTAVSEQEVVSSYDFLELMGAVGPEALEKHDLDAEFIRAYSEFASAANAYRQQVWAKSSCN